MCNQTKVCTKCEIAKDICDFGSKTKKYKKTIHNSRCKSCEAVIHREYYQANKQKILTRQKKSPSNQPEAKKEYNKKYREANLEKIRERERDYNKQHRDQRVDYLREYYKKRKETFVVDQEAYNKFRKEANDRRKKLEAAYPEIRISNNLRRSMNLYFHKELHTFEVIGCSNTEFCTWIEFQLQNHENFTMENYGKVWHLDHCLPCASFNLENKDEQRMCYHWSNISPLGGNDNIAKSDMISAEHLSIQIQEYNDYITEYKITDSVWSINHTYKKWIDVASTTTIGGKLPNSTRGNDLGNSKNVEDWIIRSQDALQQKFEKIESLMKEIHEALDEIKSMFASVRFRD
jgi:hypothetical protein